MKLTDLHPGSQVRHPEYGIGDVKVVTETTTEVLFNEGRRTLSEEMISQLKPADAQAKLEGLDKPLRDLIAEVVEATIDQLDLKVDPGELATQIAPRWTGGKLVLHPHDPSLATKEIEMEVFFRKIVGVRDYLRVLEQKINATRSSATPSGWSCSTTSRSRTAR